MSLKYEVKRLHTCIIFYQHGKHHRDDGPAVEFAHGDKKWYKNGKFHRADGPAIEYANGDKQWYKNDNLHRLDGPAVEGRNRHISWWIDGKRLTKEEYESKIRSCF